MSSPNLSISHIASNQTQKEITANTAFDELDGAIAGLLIKSISGDYTLTTTEGGEALAHIAFQFTGSLSGDANITVPTNKKLYLVNNSTSRGHTITVKTASGTGIVVASSSAYTVLYCDGTNVVEASTSGASALSGLSDVSLTSPANGDVLTFDSGSSEWKNQPSGGGGGGGGSIGSLVGYRRTGTFYCKPSTGGSILATGEVINILGNEVTPRESPDANQGEATSYDNSGSADTATGWQGSTLLNWYLGSNLHFFAELYMGSVTDMLLIAGLLGASNLGGSTIPANKDASYFRFDKTASDATIKCITSLVSGTRTITDSGITPVGGHSYRFLIITDDAAPSVKFYIDDTLVATNTTNIPTGTRCIPQASAAWHSGSTSPLIGLSQMVVQSDR